MKKMFSIVFVLVALVMAIEFLTPCPAVINDNNSLTAANSIEPIVVNDFQHVPLEIIVPAPIKFWLIIIACIGSALSNLFNRKKNKPPK